MLNLETLEEQIEKICQIWIERVNPEKIILFGSAARGTAQWDSDLDFLVVWAGKEFPNNRRRAGYLKRILPSDAYVAMDVVVLTPEQYDRARANPNSFTSWTLREGKVVYERLA